MAALEDVDLVTIFDETRAMRFLEKVAPAVYAKGGDYTSETLNSDERAVLARIGAEIRIIPFEKGYSSSELIKKLQSDACS
jgi:bifunctional ADP-heptose synthase (sugar kinase/adenylyltransferase)